MLYQETRAEDSGVSIRFVGLDPEEATPVLQSIKQLAPKGARHIATFTNADKLTDLLIAGNQLLWLSADDCIRGMQKGVVIDDSNDYADCAHLQVEQTKDTLVVWSLSTQPAVLSSQTFSVALSANTAPVIKTAILPASVQDTRNDRFIILRGFEADARAVVVTRSSADIILAQSRAAAHAPIITAARQVYVGHLDAIIEMYPKLDTALKALENAHRAADDKLSHVISTLEERLKDTKITSTAGSVASIIGVILLFTPLAPVGAGVAAAGSVASIGSSILQSYFFDPEASKEFKEILGGYTTSYKALKHQMDEIETGKDNVLKALSVYLALAHTYPWVGASVNPSSAHTPSDPKAPEPRVPYIPNKFSLQAAKGLDSTESTLTAQKALAAEKTGLKASSKITVEIESDLGKLLRSAGVKSMKDIEIKGGAELAEVLGEF